MTQIDPTTPVPLYYQLKMMLKEQIEQGELKPGDQIPTEAELCDRYQISRTPVRQALLDLVREGVLTRTAGRGTFVASHPVATVTLRVTVPDERWQRPLAEATRLWNERQPEQPIALDFHHMPLTELHDHLSLAVAQGEAPDLSILDSVWVAEFARRRYLQPLADLDPAWTVELAGGLYPSLLVSNSYNGEQFAVPTNADATVLWYRRDWLAAEGLAPPEDWEALVAIGHHFRQPEVQARYGLGPHPFTFAGGRAAGETTTYQLLPFLWTTGGDMIAGDRVVLDSPATHRALTFLRQLIHDEEIAGPEVIEMGWDGTLHTFARGEVALAFGGTYENFLIQAAAGWSPAEFRERVGFVPLPAGPGGATATLVGGMTYGIYRQSRYPTEALALLKLALSWPVLKQFSLETGQNPAYHPEGGAIQPAEDDFLGQTAALFAQGRSRPSLPAYDRVSAQFQEMAELVLSGRMAVDRAVHRAAERISGITGLPMA